jgi:hypothetical protein
VAICGETTRARKSQRRHAVAGDRDDLAAAFLGAANDVDPNTTGRQSDSQLT